MVDIFHRSLELLEQSSDLYSQDYHCTTILADGGFCQSFQHHRTLVNTGVIADDFDDAVHVESFQTQNDYSNSPLFCSTAKAQSCRQMVTAG